MVEISSAQRPRKILIWSTDPSCGWRSPAVTKADKVECGSVDTERGPVSTIRLNDVVLAVAFLQESKYNLAGVQISNLSAEPLQVDSDLWAAAHFRGKEGSLRREKPLLAETSIPTREILREMSSDVAMETSLNTIVAGTLKQSQTVEMKRSDGTRYKTDVIVPDAAAQENAKRQNQMRQDLKIDEQRRIRETALVEKTVKPTSSLKGIVYFRRVKSARSVVYSFPVGDSLFVFQVPQKK